MHRILYVDDEPGLLEIGKLFLESDGMFAVDTVTSAVAALDLLKTAAYDAIVSDYQMPVMDGIAFLRTLRQSGNQVPFIIFTGKGREEVVIEALNSGADFYLQKGGDPNAQFAELSHKIRHALSTRQGELALMKSERDYRHLVENAREAIFVIQDERLRMANPRSIELSGYPEEEIIGQPFTRFVHPEDCGMLLDRFRIRVAGTTGPADYTIRLLRKDGSVRWVEMSVVDITWDERPAILNFMTDVTKRRHAEETLREREEWYNQLFRTMRDSVFISTPGGALIDFNDSLVEMLGYGSRAEVSRILLQSVYPRPGDRDVFLAWAAREGYVRDHPLQFQRKDGSVFDALVTVMPRWNPDGTIRAFIGTIRDITNQRRTEDALRESLERYSEFFRTTLDNIFITTPEGRFIDFNDALMKTLGYGSREETFATDVPSVYADPGERVEFLAAVRCEGYIREHPIRFRRKDGTVFDSLISIVPLRNPDGSVRAYIGTVRDITDRKRSEDALKESETRYRRIFESFEDLYYQTDEAGTITLLSPSLHRLTGWTEEELIGKPVTMIYVNPKSRNDLLKEIAAKGYVRDYEVWLIRKDGTRTLTALSATRIYGGDGTPSGVAGIIRDITRRRHAEDALRESEEKFRSLVEHALEAILILDLRGTILFANNAAATTVEIDDRTGMVGRNVLEFIAPESQQDVLNDFAQVARGHDAYVARYAVETARGKKIFVESIGKVITFGGKPADLISLRDVTARRQAEEALREANKKLNLLSGITRHDIRNQVLVLQANLSMMEKRSPETGGSDQFRNVKAAARRITSIIEFTRGYEKIGVVTPAWQDLRSLVKNATEQALPGSLTVENRIPEGAEVYADPLIATVVFNLMDNAARYGGKITRIGFFVEERDGQAILVCEDDGDGIPGDDKERIFGRGFGKNTGLGLALSREILAITGISIAETGEAGRGAQFEIAIPQGQYRIAASR